MTTPRIAILKTECDVIEDIDQDTVTLWLLPNHGFYPTQAIAMSVADVHQCSPLGIKPYTFIRDTTSAETFHLPTPDEVNDDSEQADPRETERY